MKFTIRSSYTSWLGVAHVARAGMSSERQHGLFTLTILISIAYIILLSPLIPSLSILLGGLFFTLPNMVD